MNKKQRVIMLAPLWLLFTSCGQQPIGPAADPTQVHQADLTTGAYQDALQTFNQSWNQPGTSMLLARAGEPAWSGAVGKSNLEQQSDLTVSDRFRAGSITKTFVATVVMKLQEQGRVNIEQTLRELLPEETGQIPGADRIKLRHMLSHTSGLFDPANDDLQYKLDLINNPARRSAMTTRQLLEKYVYGRKLGFEPGEQFGYSNTNYWLLGMVIEKTTGQPLQAVLEELIFKPLGLKNTYLDVRNDREVVRGYTDFYNNGNLMDVTALDRADSQGQASGGLITTLKELYVFSEALFGGKIIGQASLKAMMTLPAVQRGTTEYGLGLDSYQSLLGTGWGHNGTLLGVDANWFHFPEKQATYILFGNNGGGADKSFVDDLLAK